MHEEIFQTLKNQVPVTKVAKVRSSYNCCICKPQALELEEEINIVFICHTVKSYRLSENHYHDI